MLLTPIEYDKNLFNTLNRDIPEYVIQEKKINQNVSLSFVPGSSIIDILNSVFGPLNWDFYTVDEYVRESTPFFVKKSAYFNPDPKDLVTTDKGQGAFVNQGPVAWVKGRLVVRSVDENGNVHTTVKEAYGSKAVIGKQSEQEHIFKAAQTDALKKAASLLGIGLQLYRSEDGEKFFDSINKNIIWTEERKKDSALWHELEEIMTKNDLNINNINNFVIETTDFVDIHTLPENILQDFINILKYNFNTTEK